MTTVRNHLDTCQFLLNRARLAGDDVAVRRLSERRDVLVRQLAGMRAHLHLVKGAAAGLSSRGAGPSWFHPRGTKPPTSQ